MNYQTFDLSNFFPIWKIAGVPGICMSLEILKYLIDFGEMYPLIYWCKTFLGVEQIVRYRYFLHSVIGSPKRSIANFSSSLRTQFLHSRAFFLEVVPCSVFLGSKYRPTFGLAVDPDGKLQESQKRAHKEMCREKWQKIRELLCDISYSNTLMEM